MQRITQFTIMIRKPLNQYTQGIARTIKANYYKQSLTNFTRGGSMGATGVIEYDNNGRHSKDDIGRML